MLWWLFVIFPAAVLGYVLMHNLSRSGQGEWRRARADRLIVRVGIPVDERTVSLIDRRLRVMALGSSASGLVGVAIIAGALMIDGDQFSIWLASWGPGLILVATMALGEALAALSQFAPKARGSVRIARALRPRLDDYLHPAWVWATVAVCALALVCGSVALLGTVPGAEASGLTSHAVTWLASGALLALLAAFVISRVVLATPQSAHNETDLRWDDVLRGMALRQLWIAAFTLSWAALVLGFIWMAAPDFEQSSILSMLILLPFLLTGLPASRRTEWFLWPDAVAAESAEGVVSQAS